MARYPPGSRRLTLGADKAYDVHEFVDDLRDLNATPHIAQDTTNRGSAIDVRTTRHSGQVISQQKRKRTRNRSAGPRCSAGSLGRCCAAPPACDSSSPSQWQPTTSSGCPNCSEPQHEERNLGQNGIYTARATRRS
jgi:hypothetical protein